MSSRYWEEEVFSRSLMKRLRIKSHGKISYIKENHRWKRVYLDKLDLIGINSAKHYYLLRKNGDESGSRSVALRLKAAVDEQLNCIAGLNFELKVVLDESKRSVVVFTVFKERSDEAYWIVDGKDRIIDIFGSLYLSEGYQFNVKLSGHKAGENLLIHQGKSSWDLESIREDIDDALDRAISIFRQREIGEELMIRFCRVKEEIMKNDVFSFGSGDTFRYGDYSIIVERINEVNGKIESEWEMIFDESGLCLPCHFSGFEDYNDAALGLKEMFGLVIIDF